MKTYRYKHRMLAVLLALCMAILPLQTAFAADTDSAAAVSEEEAWETLRLLGKNALTSGIEVTNEEYVPSHRIESTRVTRGVFRETDMYGNKLTDEFYMWRQNLSGPVLSAYDELCAALAAGESHVWLSQPFPYDSEVIRGILAAIEGDHPGFFWLGNSIHSQSRNGMVVSISLELTDKADNLPAAKAEFDRHANPVIMFASTFESDVEKEKAIHDWIAYNTTYNLDAPHAHATDGVLVDHEGVCESYVKAFTYCMQKLGIPTTMVSSTGHGWNMVRLDGDYYIVDVTFDDTGARPGTYKYKYFNVTDSEAASDGKHTRNELSRKLPQANGTRHSYNAHFNGFLGTDFSTFDPNAVTLPCDNMPEPQPDPEPDLDKSGRTYIWASARNPLQQGDTVEVSITTYSAGAMGKIVLEGLEIVSLDEGALYGNWDSPTAMMTPDDGTVIRLTCKVTAEPGDEVSFSMKNVLESDGREDWQVEVTPWRETVSEQSELPKPKPDPKPSSTGQTHIAALVYGELRQGDKLQVTLFTKSPRATGRVVLRGLEITEVEKGILQGDLDYPTAVMNPDDGTAVQFMCNVTAKPGEDAYIGMENVTESDGEKEWPVQVKPWRVVVSGRAKPKPSPEPDPKPSPEPDLKPSPQPDPKPSPDPDSKPSPDPDPIVLGSTKISALAPSSLKQGDIVKFTITTSAIGFRANIVTRGLEFVEAEGRLNATENSVAILSEEGNAAVYTYRVTADAGEEVYFGLEDAEESTDDTTSSVEVAPWITIVSAKPGSNPDPQADPANPSARTQITTAAESRLRVGERVKIEVSTTAPSLTGKITTQGLELVSVSGSLTEAGSVNLMAEARSKAVYTFKVTAPLAEDVYFGLESAYESDGTVDIPVAVTPWKAVVTKPDTPVTLTKLVEMGNLYRTSDGKIGLADLVQAAVEFRQQTIAA